MEATHGLLQGAMRAVISDRRSKTGRSFREVKVPKPPGPGELLVKVCAVGINPVDYKLPFIVTNGNVVGLDFSGIVVAAGSGVDQSAFAVGSGVFGNKWGTLAEYILVNPKKVAPKPEALSHADAAALPTAYLTSLQALRTGRLAEGGSVLIVGASGGCGLAGVQLAKALGASQIVGVCSEANRDLVVSQGCTDVIDYRTEKILKSPQDSTGRFPAGHFDVCYDTATASGGGEDYLKTCREAKKPGGMHVAINAAPTQWIRKFLRFEQKAYALILTQHSRADLETILQLLEKVQARPIIDSVHAFDAAGVEAAFERLHSRRAKGKVIVEMAA